MLGSGVVQSTWRCGEGGIFNLVSGSSAVGSLEAPSGRKVSDEPHRPHSRGDATAGRKRGELLREFLPKFTLFSNSVFHSPHSEVKSLRNGKTEAFCFFF